MEKFLKIWNSSVSGKLCLSMDVGYGYSDVVLTYLESKKDVDEDIEENLIFKIFTNYIETTWVGKMQTRTGARTPLYAVDLWNKYAEVLEGLPVTNNQCESLI